MTVLIDTNVMIDFLLNREPFVEAAESIIDLCDQGKVTAYITANTVADIYYVVRKSFGDKKAREVIEPYAEAFCVDMKRNYVIKAFESPMKDYEDAMLAECAVRLHAEYIVTRDDDFAKSPIPAISPSEFVKLMQ